MWEVGKEQTLSASNFQGRVLSSRLLVGEGQGGDKRREKWPGHLLWPPVMASERWGHPLTLHPALG